jgi:hypothetical protein
MRTKNLPFSDPEFAKAASKKAVDKRRENRELEQADPETFFRRMLAEKRRSLIRHLLDAVEGRGIFGKTVECACGRTIEVPGLPATSRLSALQTALSYSVGRPKPGVSLFEPSPKQTEDGEGFTIE